MRPECASAHIGKVMVKRLTDYRYMTGKGSFSVMWTCRGTSRSPAMPLHIIILKYLTAKMTAHCPYSASSLIKTCITAI